MTNVGKKCLKAMVVALLFCQISPSFGMKEGNAENTPQVQVEELYNQGKEYFENRDYQRAADFYKEAARQNHALAAYKLGELYRLAYEGAILLDGVSEKKSQMDEAIHYYRIAHQNGNKDAFFKLLKYGDKGSATNAVVRETGWFIPKG